MNSFCTATILSKNLSKTPEGFLIAKNAPVARTGTQIYRRSELGLSGDGVVSVMRPADEVFSEATVASFEGKPIVSPHPPTFISPENIAGYQKGHVQHLRKGERLPDGEHALIADLVITDASLISRIEANAIRELSAGYDYHLDEVATTDGSTQYVMRDIRGNHIAVVPTGRAGSSVRILDANPDEEEVMDIKSMKEFFADTKEIFLSLGWKAPQVQDSDPGVVEHNEEAAKRSLELKQRTLDENKEKEAQVTEEEKKKAKDAEEAKEKEAKDKAKDAEAEKEKEAKKASDAQAARFERIADALEKLVDAKSKDDDEDEEEKEKAKDAELIPTETVPPEDRPKNPIPGADKALDALLAVKSIVAKSGDRKAIDTWNKSYTELKGIVKDASGTDGYREIANRGERAREVAKEQARDGKSQAQDAETVAKTFEDNAKQYLGKNPGEVKLSEGGK
jgi:hypothetical protein